MINIIVAVAQNGVIGANGKLPWNLRLDMARFKQLTMNNVVIFGVNTFNEFKKPLAGRENVVLSTHTAHIDGAKVFDSLDKAVDYAKTTGKEIFICGGESVYKEALAFADRLYVTHIHATFDGDRYFPDIPDKFKCVSSEDITDTGIPTTFCIYLCHFD
ncbi:MAG: dihydrofolate reductase [Clostridia bacterium]|nr:dihydrofolate reductase [Clostridia bacterium]